MKFSIIVVCLNAGESLKHTVMSVASQTCRDYEILIKDGGSTDGSLDFLNQDAVEIPRSVLERCRMISQKDSGIYDAMNQAVKSASGEYFLFLNTGDYLYDETVLEQVKDELLAKEGVGIVYGNQYNRLLDTEVCSYREITPFTCYRNVPCHQTCFYHRDCFSKRAYLTKFPVRADYEHFLYCYFERKVKMDYLPIKICSYEGGGFSETKEHLKAAKKEHREITAKYMTLAQRFCYRAVLVLTLQPLRTFMANNRSLSGFYNFVKNKVYRH